MTSQKVLNALCVVGDSNVTWELFLGACGGYSTNLTSPAGLCGHFDLLARGGAMQRSMRIRGFIGQGTLRPAAFQETSATTAYDLLRQRGVPVDRRNYLGW
jgi:hypothetical protein